MNRNTEARFGNAPSIKMKRSKFDESHGVKTSFNVGELVPVDFQEVLPGDTWEITTSKVMRLPALITPIMDNLYLDTYWFFVPHRLVWSHWRELMGENTTSAWLPEVEYSVPQVEAPSGGWNVGTIADYLGIPTGVDNFTVSALPFRSYALIVNEFFRDQNLQDPANVPVDDTDITGSNGSTYVTDLCKGGTPFIANKMHDVFTSALPAPQKGPDVEIPVAEVGNLPVYGLDSSGEKAGITFVDSSGTAISGNGFTRLGIGAQNDLAFSTAASSSFSVNGVQPANLYAVQSAGVQAATINELRMAFQIQKLFETEARSGSRYIEILAAHFGVHSPDARLQRPEYLGGNRIPMRITQVLQQSESATTPQGTPTGVSLTVDTHGDFVHSFTEHGFLMCLCCVRYKHSYQQGLSRAWQRKDKFDYYFPVLSHIGEQALYNSNIYLQGSDVVDDDGNPYDDQVFGYQEAWYEYRYQPNRISGMMRSEYAASLDSWHLADDYASMPYLSGSWMHEDKSSLDRVLSVTSAVTNQIFGDIFFDAKATRVMPFYSIPGLIDHF